MDIRNTRQLKDFSAGRLANAREGQKIILYFSLITIAVSAVATVVSYILSQQIAKTGGLGSMGVRSALTTAQMLLPIVQAVFLMCLELGYLSTMLRIARGQYASPNGMRLGFDRFWVLLRCTLLKGLIFGGVAMASMYVAIPIYMMTPLSNSTVDILMPLVKNAGTSGILLELGFIFCFLLVAFKYVDTDLVVLELCGRLCPMKVLPLEGDHFLFLVLPMRLRAE